MQSKDLQGVAVQGDILPFGELRGCLGENTGQYRSNDREEKAKNFQNRRKCFLFPAIIYPHEQNLTRISFQRLRIPSVLNLLYG